MTSTGRLTDEEELKRRGLVVGGLLGEGSYAKVKWANSEELGQKVALKIISRKRAPADFLQKFMPRELELMKNLNHPHIVKLYEVYDFNDKVVMVMEMAGHGDLLEYIKLRGALPELKARKLFGQLLDAVSHIHSLNIIHRDLKCENVLLDVDSNVKLSDFGFARKLTSDQLSKTYCGSAAYAAPEVLQGIPYKGTVYDAWSLGVILYILVCGTMPYDDSDVKKMIKTQTQKKVGFSRRVRIGDDVKNLIHAILEANVERRYTLTQMSDHVWMTSAAATVDSKTVTSGGTGGSGGGGGTSAKSRFEAPHGRKLPHHKEETQPVGGAGAEAGQTAGVGGGKENGNTDQAADSTTPAASKGAVAGYLDSATAPMDRLSHNNNCAASGHEAAPKPLEKTTKTTVLIQTAGAIGDRRKAVAGVLGIQKKLNSTSSMANHLTAEMDIENQEENCQQQTINILS